ncbi:site-specific integrase [Mongoliimonas terrestris]|uniref:site-specific integrase n=1 Tax=Mongoliimonas terrestris TaxID=1709001 RepID=UPI00094988D4|nr:tyrosine-type recombinase/integrase [Mongoliimonas terrestris]
MIARRLPRYVSEFVDRHGKVRVRFRRKGQEPYYFKAKPWTPEFMAEYQACLDKEAAPRIEVGKSRSKPGTVSALIAAYLASPEFTGLAKTSQTTYRGIIERFRVEHGEKRVALIQRQHIKAIIGKKAATPAAANNLLDRIKVLMAFAVDLDMRKDNPAHGLRGFRLAGDGFHTWTEEEIARFEERHALGSKARLAFALLLYTGQRRSDVVNMGRQHVADGRIAVRQQKTDARLQIRIHPELQAAMGAMPSTNLTFLVTELGKPFSPAGFGNWFRERCNEAGLPHCSAHGLRKAASRRLAEAGCTNQQIKAITGHKTDKEVARYTAAADQVRLADQAMDALDGVDREQKLANSAEGLAKTPAKSLKRKDA